MTHLRPTTVVISTIAVGVIAVSSGVAAQTAFAATDYPSWADVQAAKADEARRSERTMRASRASGGMSAEVVDAWSASSWV